MNSLIRKAALIAALALAVPILGQGPVTPVTGAGGTSADLSNLTNPTAINLTTLTFAGAAGVTAGGTNQNITLTPSGTGQTNISATSGTYMMEFGTGGSAPCDVRSPTSTEWRWDCYGQNSVSFNTAGNFESFKIGGWGSNQQGSSSAGVLATQLDPIASSATPVIDPTHGHSIVTVGQNITSCSLSQSPPANRSSDVVIDFLENATGGFTVACAALKGLGTVNTTANEHNVQSFYWDGSAWQASTAMYSHQ